MLPVLLVFAACTTPPRVDAVDPSAVQPGQAVSVLGEGFGEDAIVELVLDGASTSLEATKRTGSIVLEVEVPAEAAAGMYAVRVRSGGKAASLDKALTVEAAAVEIPCGGTYTANTQLSLAREVVVIDRFYTDGARQTLRLPIPTIEQVEYELVRGEDGRLCSAIFMRRDRGDRVLFDDDRELDLKDRAFKMGQAMGKKVVVTRQDAPGLAGEE